MFSDEKTIVLIRFLLTILLTLCGKCFSETLNCVHRSYGNGGTVCVCNATYCDNLEPLELFPPRQYCIYTSSKDGLRFSLTKKNFSSKLKTNNGVLLTVNSNITYQTIFGFGGAFTDSASINIHALSEGAQNKLFESYFSTQGIEYNFGRVPIGGSDFSVRPYTYNDKEFDEQLTSFSLADEDVNFKIPDILKAMDMSNRTIHLLGAAWTAPPWMKTNNDYTGFGFLKEQYHKAWSDYHIRFLEEYEKHGLKFWAISTGNEPMNGLIPFFSFNCMGWSPSTQKAWITKHLGPALKQRFNETMLIALDDQRFLLPWWITALFGNNESAPYISGIGIHWYWDNITPIGLLDKTHNAFPDKFLLATEACFIPRVWDNRIVVLGSWSRGEQYAESIIDDINHWISAWIDWNLALDPDGGPNWAENFADAAIIVNKTADEFYKQPMFYAMGHFSKFVTEGSVRIDVQISIADIKATGFRTPDDRIVLVILNKKSIDIPISISGAPRGYANFVVPSKSINTIIYRDKKIPIFKTFL